MQNKTYNEIFDLVVSLTDLSGRIDERIKAVAETQQEINRKVSYLEKFVLESNENTNKINDIKKDLSVLENKISQFSDRMIHVEKDTAKYGSHWSTIFEFVFKIAVMLVGGIILWKLGLKP